jgi:type VI secretion system protein ImpH
MADPQRGSDPALIDRLFDEPFGFDFFQAVRLLTRTAPNRVPVGQDGPFAREVVRFAQHLTLSFPASSIAELERTYGPRHLRPDQARPAEDDDKPPRMTTSFMGFVGPMSALPIVYTEELVGPQARRRGAAVDFLDLFHHRLVSFFYRAWEKYNLPALWEKGAEYGTTPGLESEKEAAAGQGAQPGTRPGLGNDAFSVHLFDLIGLGLRPLRDRQAFPDVSLLLYVGLFAQQHRSALMLERLLRDYFGHPVTILSFSGQWLRLEPEQRSRSGRKGTFNALGRDAVAGRKVWDVQSKFRVRIGPLTFSQFRDLLPGGTASDRLMQLVRLYVRAEIDFDVQLILKAEEVPACRMSRDPAGAARLSGYAWLKCREFTHNSDQAVFRPRV